MTSPSGRLVVPLDGSESSEKVLPFAAALARAYGLDVEFIFVIPDGSAPDPVDLDQARQQFAEHVAGLAGRFDLSSDHAKVSAGNPAEEILKAAEGASFIAIASHGRSGFHASWIGSVADKVVRAADVPVLFIPVSTTKATLAGPVVVGVDGSDRAEHGLAAGRDLAGRLGGHVVVVRGWTIPSMGVGLFGGDYLPAEVIDAARLEAEAYLQATGKPGEKLLTAQGLAANIIESAAESHDAGCVVVTSSGKGLAQRLALGSTTDRLLHTLKVPVLIIPTSD